MAGQRTTIGWSPGRMSNPASAMCFRKYAVLSASLSRSSVLLLSSRKASRLAPTTAGASVLENRYGRDFCRSSATTSLQPAV
jgi:hypothetical protein